MRLLILTGMSGAGKSTAFKMLEDIGFYCVDNLPVPLLKNMIDLGDSDSKVSKNIAVGIDVRNGESLSLLEETLIELKQDGKRYSILFLDADDETLVKRYKETRRNHPLSGQESIQAGIEAERRAVAFLKNQAEYIIDTTHLLTRELNEELQKIFVNKQDFKNLFVTVMSFGYKYGIPQDADLVFDVRFMPNPYYNLELRSKTGNDVDIKNFVMSADESNEFLAKIGDLLAFLIPNYIKEGKNQLVIAVGCTGGKHRSVTVANLIYEGLLNQDSIGLKIEHRDIDKDAHRGK